MLEFTNGLVSSPIPACKPVTSAIMWWKWYVLFYNYTIYVPVKFLCYILCHKLFGRLIIKYEQQNIPVDLHIAPYNPRKSMILKSTDIIQRYLWWTSFRGILAITSLQRRLDNLKQYHYLSLYARRSTQLLIMLNLSQYLKTSGTSRFYKKLTSNELLVIRDIPFPVCRRYYETNISSRPGLRCDPPCP